jgi:transcriptional regulator with XRE-family HTH domain
MSRTVSVDAHVGDRVRQRRVLIGMSQTKLAEAVGVSFQQVQKYEQGANRIGAGVLHRISEVLDVDVAYFFDRMPRGGAARASRRNTAPGDARTADPLTQREALLLVRAYFRIASPDVRQSVFRTVVELSRM